MDEVQRVPELFSYLQQILDESPDPGRFILAGSNNFLIQEGIVQTLAGRIAYLTLLPFSVTELEGIIGANPVDVVHKGFYPPLFDQPVSPQTWFANYIRTYVERDVRQIRNILDLYTFERFVRLCAGRIGQLLNMNSMAVEIGVDNKTIQSWLGILESSYILFRIQPHHRSFNKRLVKMPKIYFYDTGLACALLGITEVKQLEIHPQKGSLFENFVILETLKHILNHGRTEKLYFWRDLTGREIDLIIESGSELYPVEVKAGQTVTPEFFKNLSYWLSLANHNQGSVVFAGNEKQIRSNGVTILPWNRISELFL